MLVLGWFLSCFIFTLSLHVTLSSCFNCQLNYSAFSFSFYAILYFFPPIWVSLLIQSLNWIWFFESRICYIWLFHAFLNYLSNSFIISHGMQFIPPLSFSFFSWIFTLLAPTYANQHFICFISFYFLGLLLLWCILCKLLFYPKSFYLLHYYCFTYFDLFVIIILGQVCFHSSNRDWFLCRN